MHLADEAVCGLERAKWRLWHGRWAGWPELLTPSIEVAGHAILTTNLSFSEWSQVIPNARLCKALIDRLTDRAHTITTGADFYRFRRTMAGGPVATEPEVRFSRACQANLLMLHP